MKLVSVTLLFIVLVGCDSAPGPDLFVTERTVKQVSDRTIDSDTLYAIKENFFETEFTPMANSESGFAMSQTEQDNLKLDFTSVTVTDSIGQTLEFKNTSDFLGFMDKRGFEVTNQEKKKYNTHYTFKRKK